MNKFNEISLEIQAAIINQIYLPGDLLPSENELSKKHEVSRETIRKALSLLLENGYIQKQQGKGSIVLDIKRFDFPISGLTSYKELQTAQHINSQTIVSSNIKMNLPSSLAERLRLPESTQVIYIERQRKVDGEVVILDKDYLLTSVISDMPNKAAQDSLYSYIENELGLVISYAQKEIIVELATSEDQRLMNLYDDTHVVVVRSDVYLEDTTLFQYTESRHRLDRFRFVDFARRKNPNEPK
ncbi:transcriptional regulator, GntR family [Carnobacterium iners]|uniref:Trehalose operon repressor n=1 Tax=Carnobacterium iners TaxID=1073423 RepID=A0A1X7MSZ8_9LACT|nr:trehalose operon repressor [Carnobacterium iners]SEK73794.1 transcriptional regulator, GntR family [Carnobacterium iners]SMH27468.1 transcriptional regulator, GntR family [Carnobacterium iners]